MWIGPALSEYKGFASLHKPNFAKKERQYIYHIRQNSFSILMFFQIWLWISRFFSNFTKENGLLMIDIRDMTWLICGYYNVHFLSFSLCFSRAFQILLCRIFPPMVYPPSPYAENCFVWNKFRKYPPLQNVCYYDPQYFAPNGVKIDQKGCKWTKKGWKVLTIVFFGPKLPVSLVKTIVEWGGTTPLTLQKKSAK